MQLLTAVSDELRALVQRGEFFWLDLAKPSSDEVRKLERLIGLDPRAVERTLQFGRIPEIRRYDDQVELVFFGAAPAPGSPAELMEVHVHVSGDWVVTIREREYPALDELRQELAEAPPPPEASVVARVLAALASTFDDLMDPIDAAIASLEQRVSQSAGMPGPTRALREEILDRRDRLFRVRRTMRRQRDYVDRTVEEIEELPGLEPSVRHDIGDVSGQIIRVSDWIDDDLDRLASTLDLLNSTVSNRLNAVMGRLTVVATIFLPLTFMTGFFGMNFGWMVSHIDTATDFWLLGVGLVLGSGLAVAVWVVARLEREPVD